MSLDPTGQLLDDRYEVGARIGIGGMGEVRAGFDRRLHRDVAVKFLRADLAEQDEVRRRFEHEARSAARIGHPGAVTVYDSGESEGVPYLVMELLPGNTLADRLSEGEALSVPEVVGIGLDVLDVLAAAHGLGILHRDVKPGNLLYTEDGRVKLADFGIAKTAELVDQTATGELLGTAAYLAPERLHGDAASPASDVYSVGVIMYEALAGQKPFRGDTPVSVAYAIHTAEPEPLESVRSGIDPHLATAVTRSLAKDPGKRFASAEEMATFLRASADGPAATAASSAPTERMMTTAAGPETERLPQPMPPPAGSTGRFAAPEAIGGAVRRWEPVLRRNVGYVTAAGVAIVLFGVLLLASLADEDPGEGGTDTQPTTTTSAPPAIEPLPEPLERSISELERLVEG